MAISHNLEEFLKVQTGQFKTKYFFLDIFSHSQDSWGQTETHLEYSGWVRYHVEDNDINSLLEVGGVF